ncbi:MAG: SDR family NAD(P)-dependent oxidoreductase [bacterium]|nr:SDR family NAD(P)-dependent oxidoreductase [bacterium]
MKTVLITGVGKGIGQALRERFVSAGWFVLGTYHTTKPAPNENLLSFPLDLSSSQSISKCAQAIRETGKKISVLINNAGILIDDEETDVVVKKLRETLEVNLIGTVDFTEQIISVVEDGGHVVNISSTAGSLALATNGASHYPNHYPAYKISKTALNMYTRTLSARMQSRDVIVSSVHPGWVKTEMGGPEADISPEEAAKYIYEFAVTHPETGEFWFKSNKLPW